MLSKLNHKLLRIHFRRTWRDNSAAHTKGYNDYTIGVAVIGNFSIHEPNSMLLSAIQKLFDQGVMLGKLAENYIINGRLDFDEPGELLLFLKLFLGSK